MSRPSGFASSIRRRGSDDGDEERSGSMQPSTPVRKTDSFRRLDADDSPERKPPPVIGSDAVAATKPPPSFTTKLRDSSSATSRQEFFQRQQQQQEMKETRRGGSPGLTQRKGSPHEQQQQQQEKEPTPLKGQASQPGAVAVLPNLDSVSYLFMDSADESSLDTNDNRYLSKKELHPSLKRIILEEDESTISNTRLHHESDTTFKSEQSLKSDTSSIAAARVAPKLRPQTVIFVDGPNARTNSTDSITSQDTPPPPPPPPLAQHESTHILQEEGRFSLTAEVVAKDTDQIRNEVREELIRESATAEVVVVPQEEKRKGANRILWVVLGAVACFVILAAIAGLLVLIMGGTSADNGEEVDEKTTSIPSSEPTLSPSTARPTLQPTFHSEKAQVLADVLYPISGKSIFHDTSIQARAFSFLLDEDEWFQISYNNSNILLFPRQVQERFILMVLYLATDGLQWQRQCDFFTSSHHCDWYDRDRGVRCTADRYVQQLILTENDLRGSLPPEFGFLLNLQKVELNQNTLTGTLPATLDNLMELIEWNLDYNQVSGTLPSGLFDMDTLQIFWMDENQVEGTLPPNLGNATSLRSLALFQNALSGSIPRSFSELRELRYVSLGDNLLTGPLPSFLYNEMLSVCFFFNNEITGTIPTTVSALAQLSTLSWGVTKLEGTFPTEFIRLRNLREIEIVHTQLSGTLPTFASTNLAHVALYNNDFHGTLDAFLTPPPPPPGSSQMIFLDLESNRFSGTIPATLWEGFTGLEHLVLAGNGLNGTLSTAIGMLNNLQVSLDISRNNLHGSLPTELGNLSGLQLMLLGDNQFTGPIPSQLGECTDLVILQMGNNLLTGTIPDTLSNLSLLDVLALENNNLGGTAEALCNRTDPIDSFGTDCDGEVVCSCCTVCCDANNQCT